MNKWFRTCLMTCAALLAILLIGFAGRTLIRQQQEQAQPVPLDETTGIAAVTRITQIATSPDLPGVMLAGMDQYGGSVLYSLDGGVRWQTTQSLPWSIHYAPQTVALARGNKAGEARLLVAGQSDSRKLTDAVFRLSIGQTTWAKSGIPACPLSYTREYFSEMLISPADPQRVYVTRYCDDYPRDMHDGEKIATLLYEAYASTDGGQRFQRVYHGTVNYNPPVSADRLDLISTLTPSPVNPDYVFMGGRKLSRDGGKHWESTHFPVSRLTPDGVTLDRLYGIREAFGQPDVGMTQLQTAAGWKEWANQPCDKIGQIVAYPTQTGVLFVRCEDTRLSNISIEDYPPKTGLWLSTDSGNHWKRLSDWSGHWFGPDYGTPGRMLWARDDGLWASTDLGEHWTQLTGYYQSNPDRRAWENITPPDAPLDAHMAVVSADDIWLGDMWGALMHWDGQAWRRVAYPNDQWMTIYNLEFAGPNNGWMIAGDMYNPAQDHIQAAYHWDGQTWQQAGDRFKDGLLGITAIGDQAWVVGENGLIAHWDGSSWSEMDNPLRQVNGDSATNTRLSAIHMISPEEGWAVGGNPYQNNKAAILHYQQGAWALEYNTGDDNGIFKTINMVAPNLGWAGGYLWFYPEGMLTRWDGKTWQPEASVPGFVDKVDAASAQDAWAGGDSLHHWDGKSWTAVDLPATRVQDLAVLPDGGLWLTVTYADVSNYNFILKRRGS